MISSKIVLIDDDDRVIKALRSTLLQYEVVAFNSGEAALSYLSKPNCVDLIILDVCMKGLNGLEVLERFRSFNKNTPVIMLTGQATQDIVVESLRCHADDFIEKPYDIDDLRNRIRKLLKHKEVEDVTILDADHYAQRIKNYIDRNFAKVTLADVASELCLSEKYVGQIFISFNKIGFREYKLQLRMEKAKKLLSGSALSISSVARELGYENPESFMRTFKSYYRITANGYRKQLQKENKIGTATKDPYY